MSSLQDVEVVIKSLQSLISDREIASKPPQELLKIKGFETIYNSLLELRKAFISIGTGELNYPIVEKGYLPGSLKALQASMQHLTWQTKAIAAGDFTQSVDFLGEFSKAFNHMTKKLESTLNEATRAENDAREAKEHFELIFNTSPDAALITRLHDGLIVNINQAFLDVTHYIRDEVIGETILALKFYENIADRQKVVSELSAKGFCKDIEMNFRKKDGENITGLISANIIKINGISHMIVAMYDITQRKQSEEILRKSEERYRVLAENIKDVIWIIDAQTMRFLYISPSVYRLRGYTPEEIILEPIEAALTPEGATHIREAIRQRVQDLISGKENPDRYYIEEIEQPCKDGTIVWTEVITTYYVSKETGHVEIRGVTRDISERKITEVKLQKSEEKYRILFDNAIEAIVVVQDAVLKFYNPMMIEFSGYSKKELSLMPFIELIYPDDREVVYSNHTKRLQGEFVETLYHFRLVRKDHDIRWVEMNSILIDWEEKSATLSFLTDITERKKTEEKILYLSYHDQLTGLYNRRFYEEELIRIDMEENLPITLVMADVNGLKLTNDAFGHLAGDKLIQKIGEILKDECRADDIIARIGGDEFILLLPKTDAAETKKIIQRINRSISNKKMDHTILSISFGWATKHEENEKITKVYTQAEDHMYRQKLSESTSMKHETIKLITKTLYEKNEIEQCHCERVSGFCKNIGIALGLSSDEVNELGIAGLVHDIGKIGIDEKILNKTGKLTGDEWTEMKRHPEIGYQILKSVNEFVRIAEFVLAHHERLDGKGYPKGLKGDEIPLQSKILCIAEVYDAIISDQIYKDTVSQEMAILELKNSADIQLDAHIAKIFVEKVLGKKWN